MQRSQENGQRIYKFIVPCVHDAEEGGTWKLLGFLGPDLQQPVCFPFRSEVHTGVEAAGV